MYYPSLKEFLKLAKKSNVIAVYKEISADLDTPVSAFLKIKKDAYAFLLESVEGKEQVARYSFLGTKPSLVFKSKGRDVRILAGNKKAHRRIAAGNTPLDEIKKIMRRFKAAHVKGLPRFYGGMVGFMGYDMVRFFERIPEKNPDDLKLPDAVFILTDTILIFDHLKHTIKIVSNVMLAKEKASISQKAKTKIYNRAIKKIESISEDFRKLTLGGSEKTGVKKSRRLHIRSNLNKAEFAAMVRKAKGYIRKGEVIQVVISQRFKAKIGKRPFDIYRALRSLNPSPYMFFLQLKGMALIGSSPEMLVRCEAGIVRTRPIAGTRRRGKTEEEEKRFERELLNDKKERAEHIMLVDLGRNDLGRACRPGTVEVGEFMAIEKYSHVMHLVSEVRGALRREHDIYDCLRFAYPAGTVTGSPKIRAMEIIEELENVRRGPYAGCVGYFSFSHNMDTCITIRTIVIKGNNAYIQAGAGIVADSIARREYFETINKARALMEAINS